METMHQTNDIALLSFSSRDRRFRNRSGSEIGAIAIQLAFRNVMLLWITFKWSVSVGRAAWIALCHAMPKSDQQHTAGRLSQHNGHNSHIHICDADTNTRTPSSGNLTAFLLPGHFERIDFRCKSYASHTHHPPFARHIRASDRNQLFSIYAIFLALHTRRNSIQTYNIWLESMHELFSNGGRAVLEIWSDNNSILVWFGCGYIALLLHYYKGASRSPMPRKSSKSRTLTFTCGDYGLFHPFLFAPKTAAAQRK